MLVDMLGFYPITTVTTTGAQTPNNTATPPRHTDGAGVQAILVPDGDGCGHSDLYADLHQLSGYGFTHDAHHPGLAAD